MKASHALCGLVVITGLSFAGPALSESAADHASHHPASAATAPARANASPAMGGMSGMGQNDGMMDGNMMSMMANMMASHIEGRLAFLKTELKITPDQSDTWNRYADAYRAAATSMHAMHDSMMGMMQGDLPSRMAARQKMMAAHLDALNAVAVPLNALYAVLTPDQKKSADELLGMGV